MMPGGADMESGGSPAHGDVMGGSMHLAFFHAPWCGVCHEKAPVVEQIAQAARMELACWNLEDDEGRAEADRRRIRTVPTLALIRGERVPFRLVGRMITPENVRHLLAQCAPDRDDSR
jgi:thiol-disulfide isomerase/thioredoxin